MGTVLSTVDCLQWVQYCLVYSGYSIVYSGLSTVDTVLSTVDCLQPTVQQKVMYISGILDIMYSVFESICHINSHSDLEKEWALLLHIMMHI